MCSCTTGQQSLAAILHLRRHFTTAFHLLPMFTMFGPLHIMKFVLLYGAVQ